MKIAPDLPPPVTSARPELRVEALVGIKPVRPVEARTRPPPTVQPHVRHEHDASVEEERRHDPHVDGERRTYCRRTEHLPVLLELRSGVERRRHNQRAGDIAEHIDVKA